MPLHAGYTNASFSADYSIGWGGQPAAVVEYWLSVQATRDHILSDQREIGVGFASNPTSTGVYHWYVYYATRR